MRPSARTLWIVLAAVLAASSGPLPAAARAELRGTALDAHGRAPIVGAVVMLHSREQNGTHYLTSSDPEGHFLFHSLGRGSFDLEVSLPGYHLQRKTHLDVRPPFRTIVEVLMEPGADPEPQPPVDKAAGGAGDATLALTLTGPDTEPVPEGLASLVPLSYEGERTYGRSDPQGHVTFAGLRSGRYRLVASAPGFLTVHSESVELASSGPSQVIVILTPYPLDYAGNLEDLLPPEQPLLPRRMEIDLP